MAKNIGANVSLVEGKQDILSYNEHWQTYSVTVGAGQTATIGTAVSEFKGVAFFGDGTSGTSTTGTFEHTYENAGTYIVRVFNLYNIKVVTFYVDDEVYESVEVDYGDLVEQPTTPSKEHYRFVGWYKEDTFVNTFDFSKPIVANTNIYAKFDLLKANLLIQSGTNSSLTVSRTASPYGEGSIGELTGGYAVIYTGDVLSITVNRTNAEEKDLKLFAEIGNNNTVELFSGDEDTYTTTFTVTDEWLLIDPDTEAGIGTMRIVSTTNNWALAYDIGWSINREGETTRDITTDAYTWNSIWRFSTTYNGEDSGVAFSGELTNQYSIYNLEIEGVDLTISIEKSVDYSEPNKLTLKADQIIQDESKYIETLNPLKIYKLDIS